MTNAGDLDAALRDRSRSDGPALGSRVRYSYRRVHGNNLQPLGTVVGAELWRDCAIIVWDHTPGTEAHIPYSWLVEVTS